MGSLVLAGAAEGLGKGIVANVDNRIESREKDLDRQHDVAIQRMRDQAAGGRLQSTQDFAREQYDTQRTDTLADVDSKRTYEASLLGPEQDREDAIREDEQEHDVFIEAMRQYTSGATSRTTQTKDGKWEMKVLTKGEIGPDNFPVETDTFVVREPGTPFSFVQEGMTMLPHNYTDEQKQKALSVANSGADNLQRATDDLLKNAGTGSDRSNDFMEAYGFLPASYFRKLGAEARAGGAGSFENFYQNFRKRGGGTPGNNPERRPETPAAEPDRGGVMNQASNAERDMAGAAAQNSISSVLSPEEVETISSWINGQMQQ